MKLLSKRQRKVNRVLIEIGHPNDVHQFKYLYSELKKSGIDVFFLVKKKDIVIQLMESYNLPYKTFATTPKSFWKKIITLPLFTFKYFRFALNYKPDIILSRISPHSAHASFLLRIPHIGFADTESSGLLDTISVPFTDIIFTSVSYKKDYPKNHIKYNGYIETWYLHPSRYKPNPTVLDLLGVKEGEMYFVLRFVSWNAHHDRGLTGLTDDFKKHLVKKLSGFGKVFISSELELPDELKKYTFNIPPHYMHDALYYSTLFYGESATMASECAMLGTPAVFIDPICRLGYTEDLEQRFDLIKNFRTDKESLEKSLKYVESIISSSTKDKQLSLNHKKLINEVIDPISFFKWFIENFPDSFTMIKKTEPLIKPFK